MVDVNVAFSRTLLKNIRNDLYKKLNHDDYRDLMKHFWVYRYSDGLTEVHVNKGCKLFPNGYYEVIGTTSNMYHAKAEGLSHIYDKLYSEQK